MKSAKRILAIVMAMLMVIGTCAIAASAAVTAAGVQSAINAAADSYTLPNKVVGSLVIDGKDGFTLDLNGYELVSDNDTPAITITNSTDVTIRNGQLFSVNARKGWEDTFNMIKDGTSTSAITIIGSEVTLEGLRIDAGRTFVPHATGDLAEWAVPTGSAIQASGNADVTLKQVSAVGDYAVYNASATVTVEDAILVGYLGAVKEADKVSEAEGTENVVNAADRITGFLNSGIKLETYEMDLLKKVMGDRVLIYTKTPDAAAVTVTNGTKVDVEAVEQDFIWANGAGNLGTDCSYKYIPEYFVLADGSRYALTAEDGKYTAHLNGELDVTEEAYVSYRLELILAEDIQELISEYDNWDLYYQQGLQKIKDLWYDQTPPRGNDFMGAWTYYTGRPVYVDDAAAKPYSKGVIQQVYAQIKAIRDDVYRESLEVLGPEGAVDLMESNEDFRAVMIDLFELVGSRLEADKLRGDKVPGVSKLGDSAYEYFYGVDSSIAGNVKNAYRDLDTGYYDFTTAEIPAGVNGQQLYIYGLLDKIGLMVDDVDGFIANIDDQSTWKNIAYWGYVNLDNFIDLVNEADAALVKLFADVNNVLNNADLAEYIPASLKTQISDFEKYSTLLSNVADKIDAVMEEPIVTKVLNKLDRQSEATLKQYMDKAVYMWNNRDTYFTPEKFLLEGGTVAKAYSVHGPVTIDIVNIGDVKLTFRQNGAYDLDSGVQISVDGADPVIGQNGEVYQFDQTISLTAVAAGDDEFLYWVNKETNRVVSTLETLTFNTKIDRDIVAEFVQTYDAETGDHNAIATFTNTTGGRVGTVSFDPNETEVDFASEMSGKPFLPGYDFKNWAYEQNGAINLTAAAADTNNKYVSGNSMFESMTKFYDEKGYALPVRTGSDSVIVTPVFALASEDTVHVTFLDPANNTRYNSDMKYGYTTTVTASGSNFSYWKDADTNEIVCFSPAFTYQSISNMVNGTVSTNFVAVYGASTSDFYKSRIIVSESSDKYTLYVQRTTKDGYSINTNGVVLSFTNSAPEVNAADSLKSTAKDNSNNGLYVVAIPKSFIPNGVVYVRPYAEINGTPEYGTPKTITL